MYPEISGTVAAGVFPMAILSILSFFLDYPRGTNEKFCLMDKRVFRFDGSNFWLIWTEMIDLEIDYVFLLIRVEQSGIGVPTNS